MLLKEPYFGCWYNEGNLGSGSFGTVYSICRTLPDGQKLHAAMKVLRVPRSGADVDELISQGYNRNQIKAMYRPQLKRLLSEIEVLRSLRGDDHIVIYEDSQVVEDPNDIGWEVYIRMEKLENLSHYFKRTEAKTEDLLNLWIDIATALKTVHANNLIHRDIKPENILVSAEGLYKLTDFGIARHLDEGSAVMTRAGTFPYMAPEVNRHDNYDKRVDIYSLGLVVYGLFNHNRYPFLPPFPQNFYPDDRDRAQERRFSGEKIPQIPNIPQNIWKVLAKCIEFDPQKRYSDVDALLEDLRNLRVSNEVLSNPVDLTEKKHTRSWRVMLLIFLIALVAYLGAYIAFKLLG